MNRVIPAATRTSAVRGTVWAGAVLLATTALAGCFTSTNDFRSDAETFISERVAPEVDAEFTSVNCDEPVDQQVDTRFACQAIDANGGVWEFDNVIDAAGEFTVNISKRP